MKIQEALKTNKPIKRSNHINAVIQYYEANTGPNAELVTCSYFMVCDDNEWYFTTSLDLYPEDIFADDWEIA